MSGSTQVDSARDAEMATNGRKRSGWQAPGLLDVPGRLAPPLLLALLLVAGWEIAVPVFGISAYIIPRPSLVAQIIAQRSEFFIAHTWVTTQEIVYGFLLSVVVGVVLALLLARFRTVYRALYPILVVLQVVPKVALAPIFILWFGFGIMPKLLLTVFIAFFTVTLNMLVGLRSVDPNLRLLMQSVGASRGEVMLRIEIPNSLPYLMTGLKLAITLSVIGAIVGEFAGASEGLGYLIFVGSAQLDTPLVFAALVIVSALGVALYYAVVLLEWLIVPWSSE